jgi:hypothetical protein
LEDFFKKSWIEGGLTIAQTFFLFDTYQDRKYSDNRFLAILSGIDLDKELKKTPSQTSSRKQEEQQGNFIFGDPTEYEKLPEEDRIALTKNMMGEHQAWAKNLYVNI